MQKVIAQNKQKVKEEKFHIAMTKEMEREVSEMSDLNYGFYENGCNEGLEEG